jgi:hypothetical protein
MVENSMQSKERFIKRLWKGKEIYLFNNRNIALRTNRRRNKCVFKERPYICTVSEAK